jgi:hypothetical protein
LSKLSGFQVRDELRDDISDLHAQRLASESALAEASEKMIRVKKLYSEYKVLRLVKHPRNHVRVHLTLPSLRPRRVWRSCSDVKHFAKSARGAIARCACDHISSLSRIGLKPGPRFSTHQGNAWAGGRTWAARSHRQGAGGLDCKARGSVIFFDLTARSDASLLIFEVL